MAIAVSIETLLWVSENPPDTFAGTCSAFFAAHPELDNAPIWVHFESTVPRYNVTERWGYLLITAKGS
ncbi:MAG: staygreen family protein [Halobacteriota archaeon]